MIAQRFRPIGWVIGVAIAIMLLYVVQLQVANERGKLKEVDQQIALLRKDIRRLNTEFETRASMRQLERWNGDVAELALSAPQARQYLAGESDISDIGDDRFEGHGVAPPPAMVMAATNEPEAAQDVSAPAAVVQTAALPVSKARQTVKDMTPVLIDKSKPVPQLSARDRAAQREIAGRPALAVAQAKVVKVAQVQKKKSLLGEKLSADLDRAARKETAPKAKERP